jgi:DNA-binding NtrC family response regulator
MSKVLVVDDEQSYREYLGRFLARDGHEVRVAESGHEALEIGVRFRPDVLVVDWMLKNHVHGLHVAQALSAIRPDMASILITGFPSGDLKAAAERARIFRFIEKPFDVEEIREAVAVAAVGRVGAGAAGSSLALVETDADLRIRYANPAARVLLGETQAGPDAERFADAFAEGRLPDPEAAARGWVAVAVASRRRSIWEVRTHPEDGAGTRLWILRRRGERTHVPLVEMILGVEEPLDLRWPCDGRVLVVDDDELFRHVARAILESAGAACYAAEDDVEALRLLEHDEGIRSVVLDFEIPGVEVGSLVERIRGLRPEIAILGNSAFERGEEFAKLGVDRFVRKPWRAADLAKLLQAR